MREHMRFVAPDGLWTGLLGPQTVASARASRRPGEPLDGPPGAPDGLAGPGPGLALTLHRRTPECPETPYLFIE